MSLTHKPKLKPCPFCGEADDIAVRPQRHHGAPLTVNGKKFWTVECLPCDAQTGNCFDGDAELFGFKDGREMAIFQWNIRYTFTHRLKRRIILFTLDKLKKLDKYLNKQWKIV